MFRTLAALILVTLIVFVSSAQNAGAQTTMSHVDEAFFQGLHYRLVGPSRGGGVSTAGGGPPPPETFYLGGGSGGVFRANDGGATLGAVPAGGSPPAASW